MQVDYKTSYSSPNLIGSSGLATGFRLFRPVMSVETTLCFNDVGARLPRRPVAAAAQHAAADSWDGYKLREAHPVDGYLNYLVRERVFGNINDFVAERSQAQEERLGAGMWSRAGAEDPCVAGYP